MKNIIVLSLMACTFTAMANNPQSANLGHLQPYRNITENYTGHLITASCELALKGEIKTDVRLEEAISGVLAQVTRGMNQDTTAYSTIHDAVMLGAAVGLNIKDKGKTMMKDKVFIYTCTEFSNYINQKGLMSGFAAGLTNPEVSTRTKSAQGSSDRVYRTTARALAAMYDENEVAADEKIAGRKVEVTGVVQSIDKDFTDSIVVLLASNNDFMPARFGMEQTEKSKAASLRKGQTATIICERMTFLMGSPSGRSCKFN